MTRLKFLSRNRLAKHFGDLFLITLAYYSAFFLRFDGYILPQFFEMFLKSLPLVVVIKVALLQYHHSYDSFWRYTGLPELKLLFRANSLALFFIMASYTLWAGLEGFPRSVFFLDWFLSLCFLSGFRVLPRVVGESRFPNISHLTVGNGKPRIPAKKVLLYGAGDLGVSIERQIQQTYSGSKKVIGFIDDNPALKDLRIGGVPVLGDRSILPDLARTECIDEILIAISGISGQKLNGIVEHCRQFSSNVQIVPGLNELFLGNVQISDLREVQIEDLLGRAKVDFDGRQLGSFLGDKRILVTGAGGSIGSELCFQILKFQPSKLILLDRDENSSYEVSNRLLPYVTEDQLEVIVGDVTNSSKLTRVFGRLRPEIVFHAAADKQVPLMELNPDESVFNNIIGTQTVLDVATQSGVGKVICISTDKAVNPSSVMGCCKRVTELLLRSRVSTQTVCCAVRFGNVLGSRGSVVPLFKKQIAQGGPVTVTHPDIKRYFMTIQEAVILVLQAGALSTGGEIFLLDMGEQIRIQDLAQQMIELSGRKNGEVPIEFVGLRPGEKLEEELSFSHETIERTISSRIHRLKSNGESVNRLYLRNRIEKLRRLVTEMDFEGIRAVLKDLVPEYRPEGQPWSNTEKAIQRETLSAK